LAVQASRFARKHSLRIGEIHAEGKDSTVADLRERNQMLSKIIRAPVDLAAVDPRAQIAAATELNKVEKVYDAGASDRQLVIILRDQPRVSDDKMQAIDVVDPKQIESHDAPEECNTSHNKP